MYRFYKFKFQVGDRVQLMQNNLHQKRFPGSGTVIDILPVSDGDHRYRIKWDGIKYDSGGYFPERWIKSSDEYEDFKEKIYERMR